MDNILNQKIERNKKLLNTTKLVYEYAFAISIGLIGLISGYFVRNYIN